MKLGFRVFFVIGILIVVSAVVILFFYPKSNVYNENFEEGFDGWIRDADVPTDPNNLGHSVAWNNAGAHTS